MQVDISFGNARVYNIEKVDVRKGEAFTIHTDAPSDSRWFADNDPVLSVVVSGTDAEVQANEIGTTTILIMDAGASTAQKQLTIKVVAEILPVATDLGITAGQPEPK